MPMFQVDRNAGEIKGLANLLTEVRRARKKSPKGAVWLRGLPKEHQLVPSIGRPHKYAGRTLIITKDQEEELLHRFRRYAYEYVGRTLNEWEAIFAARHHELPVRLMDWTTSPHAALYFACDHPGTEEPEPGKIWMLIPKRDGPPFLDVLNDKNGPFKVKGVRLIYPMVVAPRINAQSGFFTIQEDPWKPLDGLQDADYSDDEVDILRLIEYAVPPDIKDEMLHELNQLGVNRRTLFPDLDGLARGLLHDQIMRKT